jgi:hypothetical protein
VLDLSSNKVYMKTKEFNKVKPYVYWVKNLTTSQKYFGVRWANATRFKRSPNQDFGKYYFTSSTILQNEFKNNPKNFKYKILYTFDTLEEAREYELNFTKKVVKNNRWINKSSWPVVIKSPEERKKHGEFISKIQKGRIFNDQWKAKISKSKEGSKNAQFGKPSPMRGKKYSAEVRKKMSDARKGKVPWNKGRKYSKETKDKMKGFKHSIETKKKISEFNKTRKRSKEEIKKATDRILKVQGNRVYKPLSVEHKRKISLTLKGRKVSAKTSMKISKALKGGKRSSETKKKISESLKNRSKL